MNFAVAIATTGFFQLVKNSLFFSIIIIMDQF